MVFITNAPRPGEAVMRQLDRLKVPRETCDAIASSGDVTRHVIAERKGQSLCHIGPERDHSIFTGLDVTFAPLETADYVVCSGLDDDDNQTPEDFRARLEIMLKRKLFMVCGNPDLVVERGDRLVYCAGSIAEMYEKMGGEVLYAGKPYRPIYELALEKAESRARPQGRPQARHGDRRFGAHRSCGRRRLRHRHAVHDRRHSCRGTGRPHQRPIPKS